MGLNGLVSWLDNLYCPDHPGYTPEECRAAHPTPKDIDLDLADLESLDAVDYGEYLRDCGDA